MELNTYGDLKKVIKAITLKQKAEKIGDIALGTLIGFIPGAEAAKTTFDFIRAAISKPYTKKTKTWLDKLDIDDEMSAIVDDTVENGFMQMMSKTIESKPDTQQLEPDFNMNAEMVKYLKDKYEGRTVSGIKENKTNKMKKSQLKLLIKEEIVKKTTSSINTINKDLDDQKSNFKNITTKDKMIELVDSIFNRLDPKFKDSPMFKQAILDIYKKYK
jgi:hypothetical protein